MLAYQTDGAGVLIGPVECDPDPLEPGRWLVPGGAVLEAPPAVTDGQRARFTGERWVVEDARTPQAPVGRAWQLHDLADALHAQRRAALHAAQEAGFTVQLAADKDGITETVTVDSDLRSQVLLTALANAARAAAAAGDTAVMDRIAGPLLRGGWRGRGGRVVATDGAGVIALADALAAHIAACDEASLAVAADIDRLVAEGNLAALLVYRVDVVPRHVTTHIAAVYERKK